MASNSSTAVISVSTLMKYALQDILERSDKLQLLGSLRRLAQCAIIMHLIASVKAALNSLQSFIPIDAICSLQQTCANSSCSRRELVSNSCTSLLLSLEIILLEIPLSSVSKGTFRLFNIGKQNTISYTQRSVSMYLLGPDLPNNACK